MTVCAEYIIGHTPADRMGARLPKIGALKIKSKNMRRRRGMKATTVSEYISRIKQNLKSVHLDKRPISTAGTLQC